MDTLSSMIVTANSGFADGHSLCVVDTLSVAIQKMLDSA